MIVLPIYIILLFVFYVLNKNAFGKGLSYANFFLVLWCVIPAVSVFGLYSFYIPSIKVHMYIILMIVVFECSTLFFLRVKVSNKKIVLKTDIKDIKWDMMLVISFICLAVLFPSFLTSIRYAMINGYYSLRIKILNNVIISAKNRLIIQEIVQPLIIVTTMVSLYELVQNRKIRLVTVVSLINCCVYMLTLGNRWLLMEVLLLIVIFVVDKYSLNIIAIVKYNKWITRIGVVLVLGMVFITTQRSIRGSDGLFYDLYSYFVGSIHLFGIAVKDPGSFKLTATDYLYGKELFASLIGLINDFLAVFGVDSFMQSGIAIINEITQGFYFVSPSTHMNNNFTMLYGFLRDGGVLGIIIDTMLLALLQVRLFKNKQKSIYHKLMYYFGISMIPFLIFEWIYGRVYVLMVFVILMILSRIDRSTIKKT